MPAGLREARGPMLYALTEGEERIRPARTGQRARCPCCRAVVIAKCGDVKVWHWAHRAADCDPWAEPETEWHLSWKTALAAEPFSGQPEVAIERDGVLHRADVVLPNGLVVELQHSSISGPTVHRREAFYRRMVWIFDAREARASGRLALERGAGPHVSFQWPHAPQGIRAATAPVLLDLGGGRLARLLEVPTGRARGWCTIGTVAEEMETFRTLRSGS